MKSQVAHQLPIPRVPGRPYAGPVQIPPPEWLVRSGPVFLSDTLWFSCTHLAENSSLTRGAVAFAGVDAAELLPLRPGDEIVVDASDARVQAGVTSPDAIDAWIKQGGTVYSVPALHAKVLRFTLDGDEGIQELTVVGSGNVSTRSAKDLIEAAVLVDDKGTANTVDAFIDLLIAEAGAPLDSGWVDRARDLYRPPTLPLPTRRQPSAFPAPDRPLWVFGSESLDVPISPELEQLTEAAELDYGSSVLLHPIRLRPGDEDKVSPGDGVIVGFSTDANKDYDGRWSTDVGRFVKVLPHDGGPPEALLALDQGYRPQRWGAIHAVLDQYPDDDTDDVIQPGTELHAALLAMWNRRRKD